MRRRDSLMTTDMAQNSILGSILRSYITLSIDRGRGQALSCLNFNEIPPGSVSYKFGVHSQQQPHLITK